MSDRPSADTPSTFRPSASGDPTDFSTFPSGMGLALAENWWMLVVRGLFAIGFAVMAFVLPGAVMLSLALLFGIYLVADGVIALVAAVRAARADRRWWLLLAEGLLNLAMGSIAIVFPAGAILAFVVVTAVWAILSGGFMLAAAFSLSLDHGRLWLAIGGLVSMLWGRAAHRHAVRWRSGADMVARGLCAGLRHHAGGGRAQAALATRRRAARGSVRRLRDSVCGRGYRVFCDVRIFSWPAARGCARRSLATICKGWECPRRSAITISISAFSCRFCFIPFSSRRSLPLVRVGTSYRAIELGLPVIWIGAIAASFALLPVIFAIPFGRLIDRGYDSRAAQAGGVMMLLGAALLWAWPDSQWELLLAQCGARDRPHPVHGGPPDDHGALRRPAQPRVDLRLLHGGAWPWGQGVGPLLIGLRGGLRARRADRQGLFHRPHRRAAASMGAGFLLRSAPPRAPRAEGETSPRILDILNLQGLTSVIFASVMTVTTLDLLVVYLPLLGTERNMEASHVGLSADRRARWPRWHRVSPMCGCSAISAAFP